MNKFIQEQLKQCNVPITPWDNDTTQIVIPLNVQVDDSHNMLKRIYIKNYILNEPSNFTLSHDWNNDTLPPENRMWVKVIETRGKMIKVEGKGLTSEIPWTGWLPQAGFEED